MPRKSEHILEFLLVLYINQSSIWCISVELNCLLADLSIRACEKGKSLGHNKRDHSVSKRIDLQFIDRVELQMWKQQIQSRSQSVTVVLSKRWSTGRDNNWRVKAAPIPTFICWLGGGHVGSHPSCENWAHPHRRWDDQVLRFACRKSVS